MAKVVPPEPKRFTQLLNSLCRRNALTLLGHPIPTMLPVGDIACLLPLRIYDDKIPVPAADVPWLHAGTCTHKCEGAMVYRHKKRIVTVPCYERRKKGSICCKHCSKLFGSSDADNNYHIDPAAKRVIAVYAQGPRKALRQQPKFVELSSTFDASIAAILKAAQTNKLDVAED